MACLSVKLSRSEDGLLEREALQVKGYPDLAGINLRGGATFGVALPEQFVDLLHKLPGSGFPSPYVN